MDSAISFLALFSALLLGCGCVYRFGNIRRLTPIWASAVLTIGMGAAVGIGLASLLFFLCKLVAPGFSLLPFLIEIGLILWIGVQIFTAPKQPPPAAQPRISPSLTIGLAAALAVALMIATGAMDIAWRAVPHGNWDAWSIWNLRARFLLGPLPQRAWSSALNWTHPEYPFLLSSFVARCWSAAGSELPQVPAAVSYSLFLSLVAVVTGGVACWRGSALGLIAGLSIVAMPLLLHETPAQYSDVALACYMTAAVILLLLDQPAWAGIMAGFAAWTKDEGILFLAVLALAYALLYRKRVRQFLVGAAPAALLVAAFKIFLAGGNSIVHQQASALLHRLQSFPAYGVVLAAFWREFLAMGRGWYHPIWPAVVLLVCIGINRKWNREMLLSSLVAALMLLGYFFVYIVTPNDLNWQLQTSLTRIFMQWWPLALVALWSAAASIPFEIERQSAQPEVKRRNKRSRGI